VISADSIISLIGIGASAFAATNIDDIFILMIFFSSHNFQARNIVLGQYLGIGSLVAISTLGSLFALVIPTYFIGLLGLVPIAIGIKELLVRMRNNNGKLEKEKELTKENLMQQQSNKKGCSHRNYLAFLSVAAVTISNGGDNMVSTPPYLLLTTLLQK
jgi:cadmium resistance protein CadD (predicted permease)